MRPVSLSFRVMVGLTVCLGMGAFTRPADAALVATFTGGVQRFDLDANDDPVSSSLWITDVGTFRRLAFNHDVTGDGHGDLFISTDSQSIRVHDGQSGAFSHTITSTANDLRQLTFDRSNNDLYYTALDITYVGRRDANGVAKPGVGASGDHFVEGVSLATFSVAIGPDGKVYIVNGSTLGRYDKIGGVVEKTASTSTSVAALMFGTDMTGDSKPELYMTHFGSGVVNVIDVFTNPEVWSSLTNVITGLNTPLGFTFKDDAMYIANAGAGDILRYAFDGTTWIASPSAGNPGALWASLPGVQDVAFTIPEPAAGAIVLLGAAVLRRRRPCNS